MRDEFGREGKLHSAKSDFNRFAGRQIDAPDALVPDVADQKAALTIEDDAVRLAQLSLARRSAVAAETWRTRARNR